MSLNSPTPSPRELLKEAKAEPHQHPFDLTKYAAAIDTLFEKEFSYAKIAKWLSARLGGTIDRGQIYYVHRTMLKRRQAVQARAALDDLQEPAATGCNNIDGAESPDPELEKITEENEARRLNAEADKEDALRKEKGRKKL